MKNKRRRYLLAKTAYSAMIREARAVARRFGHEFPKGEFPNEAKRAEENGECKMTGVTI